MLSLYADQLIDNFKLKRAKFANDSKERKRIVDSAIESFDYFAKRLNHLFDQFGVNIFATRSAFVPRQDK